MHELNIIIEETEWTCSVPFQIIVVVVCSLLLCLTDGAKAIKLANRELEKKKKNSVVGKQQYWLSSWHMCQVPSGKSPRDHQ